MERPVLRACRGILFYSTIDAAPYEPCKAPDCASGFPGLWPDPGASSMFQASVWQEPTDAIVVGNFLVMSARLKSPP